MRFIIQTIFVFMMILLISCEKEDQELSVDNLMPVNTGNIWTLRHTNCGENNMSIDTFQLEIGEKVTINSINCFAAIGDYPLNARFIVGNDDSGNFVSFGGISDVDTILSPSIQFKKDAIFGEEWNYTYISLMTDYGIFNQDTLPMKCITIDTIITTPMGRFHCKGFEESKDLGLYKTRYYLSLNIGLVRMEDYERGELISFDELIDYHLNK